MQTILGAGGVISNELVYILPQYTDRIRLVSRNPKQITGKEELFSADITDLKQTEAAVEGSDVVYLTAGLKYNINVWKEQWPKIMNNVIEACKKKNAKLLFFDNVYMYGKVDGWMTEKTPVNPCSKKGELRAKIAQQLIDEYTKGNLQAIIARAADFYGPNAHSSILNILVIDKFKKGKSAKWMANDNVKHSFTYTPDAAKATALLANTDDAYNRIWHLPTHKNVMTGKQLIETIAKAYNVQPKYSILKKWMLQLVGLFDPTIRELVEMLYQQEYDYLFDSTEFETKFFKATDYITGINKVAEMDK